jgi:CBS-domain-containing membrane protein
MIKQFFLRMQSGDSVPARKPFSEIALSWLGAFIGIYLVSTISSITGFDLLSSLFVVGSFGASAVLIYGAPQAEFSQPRILPGVGTKKFFLE